MDEVPIQAKGVSKKFCRNLRTSIKYGIQDIALNMFGLSSNPERLRDGEFWAVDNVSFEVHKGETLGIIGPNGSGKSTILKMLNGIFMPDKGEIKIRGRVGALIEIGAGFHPMLTGRENIYVNGAILGMCKREIDEKFDEIVEFADIGDFIDSPVKFYSSGMFVRLGFSIAVHMEPEVLLIDEILSVGDLSFQNKSLRRLAEIREKAKAVVFVSHNLDHIQNLCDKLLVLDNGKPIYCGEVDKGIYKYQENVRKKILSSVRAGEGFQLPGHLSSGKIIFLNSGILDKNGQITRCVKFGKDLTLFFEFELLEDFEELHFSAAIRDERRINCIWEKSNDYGDPRFLNLPKGRYRLVVRFKKPNLAPGIYTHSFAALNGKTGEVLEKIHLKDKFTIEGDAMPRGVIHAKSKWNLEIMD